MRRIFLNWLPWLLMMKRPGRIIPRPGLCQSPSSQWLSEENETVTRRDSGRPTSTKVLLSNVLDLEKDRIGGVIRYAANGSSSASGVGLRTENLAHLESGECTKTSLGKSWSSPLGLAKKGANDDMRQILNELRFITDRMRRDDDNEEIINDW